MCRSYTLGEIICPEVIRGGDNRVQELYAGGDNLSRSYTLGEIIVSRSYMLGEIIVFRVKLSAFSLSEIIVSRF